MSNSNVRLQENVPCIQNYVVNDKRDAIIDQNNTFNALTNINIINKSKIYYTIQEFNNSNKLKYGLFVISLNINSLRKHADDFKTFLESLNVTPDIIVVSEIRHDVETILNHNFPGYRHNIVYPKNNKCGGLALLTNKNINFKVKNDIQIRKEGVENLVIEVSSKKSNVIISGIYKHPIITISEFLELVLDQTSKIPKNTNYIIAGDINIDYNKYDSNLQIRNYFDKMKSKNNQQLMTSPTRIMTGSKTTIDHIYFCQNNF